MKISQNNVATRLRHVRSLIISL